ncbi:uncharacterized protein LOC100898053 [Galendromus occidentalis]|uniref:Uncharacterized protein LOC100898053 n=1 Tax=Galendromus occidentalis TaxID=34638 RepID=A0AAJ7SHN6_9ACAR|nr:uncharacterized protein LOC100898053 [Galendromus occidentalis]
MSGSMAKVCFVCGGVPARLVLFTKQVVDANGICLPYFPFLEKHTAPQGAERASADGRVLACNVCHALLQQQWETHEIQRTPHSKRTYWLKRVDNGPFSGLDLRQEDYQSHNNPQLQHNPNQQQHQQNSQQQLQPQYFGAQQMPLNYRTSTTSSTTPASVKEPISRTPVSSSNQNDSNGQNILDLSKPVGRVNSEKTDIMSNNNNTIAYDFSKQSGQTTADKKECDRTLEISSQRDGASETSDVCYVCGGRVKRGTLLNIFAKRIANCPFFPSLLNHERPPRSFPVDHAMGRIKACQSCHAFLLHQWDAYQKLNVPPNERHYQMPPPRASGCPALPMGTLPPPTIVHKAKEMTVAPSAPAPFNPSAGNFVCLTCGNEQPSSIHRLVSTTAQADNESYFGFLRRLKPPPGAPPMNAKGQVVICSPCYKNLQRQHRVFEISKVPEHKRNYKVMINSEQLEAQACPPSSSSPSPSLGQSAPSSHHSLPAATNLKTQAAATAPTVPSSTQAVKTTSATTTLKLATTNPISRSSNGPKYVGCYICEKIGPIDMLVPVDTALNREGRAFFPVIEDLPRPIAAMPMDSAGKVLLCNDCRNNLMLQWSTFETTGIPYKHRVYQVNTTPSPTGGTSVFQAMKTGPSRLPVISQASSARSSNENAALRVQVLATAGEAAASGHPSACQTLLTTVPTSSTYSTPSVAQASTKAAAAGQFVGLDLKVSRPKAAVSPVNMASSNLPQHVATQPSASEHDCFFCAERTSTMYTVCAHPVDDQSAFFPIITRILDARRAAALSQDMIIDNNHTEGTVVTCSFCYHSLMAQWSAYEMSPHIEDRDRVNRKYNTHDYVCYICGIITYRKRVRCITVKDFPFLMSHPRHGGALQLHQFESVVTCLTCFEGLTGQWREYERLRVPLEMRKYNWIAVPPPPEQDEDSNGAPCSGDGFPVASATSHGNGSVNSGGKHSNRSSNQTQSGSQFSPLNGFLPQGNGGRPLSGARTSSYAAALRKLAKQAVDPADVGKEPRSPGMQAMSPSPLPNGALPSNVPVPLTSSSTLLLPTSAAALASSTILSSVASSPSGIISTSTSTATNKPKHCPSPNTGTDSRKPIDLTSTIAEPQKKQQPSPSRGFQPYRAGSSSIISNGSSSQASDSVSPTLIPHPSPLAPSYDYNQYLLHHHQQMAAVQGGHPAFRLDDPMLFDPRYAPQLTYPYIPAGASLPGTQRSDESKRGPATSRGSIIQGTPRSEASTPSSSLSLSKSVTEGLSEASDLSAYGLAGIPGPHNDPQWFAQARLDIEKRKELQFQHELYLREQQGVARAQSQTSSRNARAAAQDPGKVPSSSPHPQPVGGLQHHQSSKFMQVTPQTSGTNGAKIPSIPTSLAGQPLSMSGLPVQGLNLSHTSGGAFTQIMPNSLNENNNVINFGEEGMHARLLETQNKHKVVKPTVIQQNGIPPFYSPFSADSLLGHPGVSYAIPVPYAGPGSASYSENVAPVNAEKEQMIVEAPLFGLAPIPVERDEEGIMSALDLQVKDKDAVGGFIERDFNVFSVTWTGPKAKLECDDKKLEFLESFGLTTHRKVKRLQCQQLVCKRKHDEPLLIEETEELSEKFWKRLLLLDIEQSVPEARDSTPKTSSSKPEPHLLNALDLAAAVSNKTDVELRWRAILKDRARRYNIMLPEPKRNLRTQDRASEAFDESLLKKARFDPKSFAQEFHESVLKDTREKLGYVEELSPENPFSGVSLPSFTRIISSRDSSRCDDTGSCEASSVNRPRRVHPAFRVGLAGEQSEPSPSPEPSQTPFQWPGVEIMMEAYHRYHELLAQEQRYLREKFEKHKEQGVRLQQEFAEVKAHMEKLEEASRTEQKELEAKERAAEKLLSRIKFLRQLGSKASTTPTTTTSTTVETSICNGHC